MQALQLRLKTISSTSKAGGGPGVAGASSLDGPREVEHRRRAQRPSHGRNRCVSIVIMWLSSRGQPSNDLRLMMGKFLVCRITLFYFRTQSLIVTAKEPALGLVIDSS